MFSIRPLPDRVVAMAPPEVMLALSITRFLTVPPLMV